MLWLILCCAASTSLSKDDDATETLDFGNTALLHPLPGVSGDALRDFYVGKSFFHSNWVTAPATTTARAGLGPYFNARACGGCHAGNGRGALPAGERIESPGALVVHLTLPGIDAHGVPQIDPIYGGELSAFAIEGVIPEGKTVISYEAITGRYADGEAYTLHRPQVRIDALAHGVLAADTQISLRLAPPIAGSGLIASVADQAIEAEAQRQRKAPGAVKGQINRVWNPLSQRAELGRYGWKADVATLTQQTVTAFSTDIGITSAFAPRQSCTEHETDCLNAPTGAQPEIDNATLARVISYVSLLAAPPRAPPTPDTRRGERSFLRAGCAACHKPAYVAANLRTPQPAGLSVAPLPSTLHGAEVRAYSDLLLHDMGEALGDVRGSYLASARQWRTPPLWGIGLTQRIAGSEAYLHDGRARSLAEAILWHGGEAADARDTFKRLPTDQRADLIEFLRSL